FHVTGVQTCALPISPRAAFIRALRIGLLVAAIGLAWPSILAQNADLIIHSGKILTVDSNDSIVEAMAVRDGIIVALGSNAEVLRSEERRVGKGGRDR